jgi:tetrahydromethanopterin S-methyltransferase subunit F
MDLLSLGYYGLIVGFIAAALMVVLVLFRK